MQKYLDIFLCGTKSACVPWKKRQPHRRRQVPAVLLCPFFPRTVDQLNARIGRYFGDRDDKPLAFSHVALIGAVDDAEIDLRMIGQQRCKGIDLVLQAEQPAPDFIGIHAFILTALRPSFMRLLMIRRECGAHPR